MPEGRELDAATRAWLAVGVRERETVDGTPLAVPLRDARVAVVSTGGARLPDQEPFRTGKLGDPSFRALPSDTDPALLVWEHPHYDTDGARRDPDTIFPLRLLAALAAGDEIGSLAPTACSMMGYAPLTRTLLTGTAPAIGELMQGEEVDAALLCPA